MDENELKTPPTQIEISKLLNIEGMPSAGRDILRRLVFDWERLKDSAPPIQEGSKSCTDITTVRQTGLLNVNSTTEVTELNLAVTK